MKNIKILLLISIITVLLAGCGIGSASSSDYHDDNGKASGIFDNPENDEESSQTDISDEPDTTLDDNDDSTVVSDDDISTDNTDDTQTSMTTVAAASGMEDEVLDANLVSQDQVLQFLRSAGVNGLLWEEFSDLNYDKVGIYNIIYQLSDDTVSWQEVYDAVESIYGEVYTDVTYLTTASLDSFLEQVLGVNIQNNCVLIDADYDAGLDIFYVMHGDTNYTTFTLDSMYIDDNKIYATLTDIDQFDNRDILVVMELHSMNQLRILSVEKLGPTPIGLGYGNEFVFENSAFEYISERDLEGLTEWELKIARNEIFARHGRKFSNNDLQFYFDNCSWYEGLYSPSEFDTSCLNEVELKNLEIIDNFQNK